MKIDGLMKAALTGLALAVSPITVETASAETLRVVREATSRTLNVPMNRAVVVESDTAFAELSIANPAIADISSLSDRTIYVLGKAPGLTTLTLLDGNGRLITNVNVRVAADISEFKERLRQILPGEGIEVRTAGAGIVLSGTLSSGNAVDRAMQLAGRYSEEVSNLMNVAGSQQVMLQVRFAEMSRTARQNLSLSLSGVEVGTDAGIGLGTGSLSGGGGLAPGSLPGGLNGRNGALSIAFSSGGTQLGILIEA